MGTNDEAELRAGPSGVATPFDRSEEQDYFSTGATSSRWRPMAGKRLWALAGVTLVALGAAAVFLFSEEEVIQVTPTVEQPHPGAAPPSTTTATATTTTTATATTTSAVESNNAASVALLAAATDAGDRPVRVSNLKPARDDLVKLLEPTPPILVGAHDPSAPSSGPAPNVAQPSSAVAQPLSAVVQPSSVVTQPSSTVALPSSGGLAHQGRMIRPPDRQGVLKPAQQQASTQQAMRSRLVESNQQRGTKRARRHAAAVLAQLPRATNGSNAPRASKSAYQKQTAKLVHQPPTKLAHQLHPVKPSRQQQLTGLALRRQSHAMARKKRAEHLVALKKRQSHLVARNQRQAQLAAAAAGKKPIASPDTAAPAIRAKVAPVAAEDRDETLLMAWRVHARSASSTSAQIRGLDRTE